MKKTLVLTLIAILLTFSASAEERQSKVTVHFGESLLREFQGFGVEWDPHAESFVPDSAWKTLTRRVDYLSPKLVRCMVLARWYISSVNGDDVTLDFNNYEMRQAMQVLDYCQENAITVIWGDWGPPTNKGLGFDSIAWARGMAKCMNYLRHERGYTCIRYCNIGNEPDGDWSDCGNFAIYEKAVKNLYVEMDKLGLLQDIMISGPDVYGNWGWLDQTLDRLDNEIGNIDFHWYPDAASIGAGNVEIRVRRKLRALTEQIGNRRVFIHEFGLSDGKTAADQQPNVREYWYGVAIVDALAQCVRGGVSGAIAWDLEDSMHPTGKEYKTWGFYNMKGGEEEQALRPWFYSYSLLCRLFPSGCTIVDTECTDDWGIRVLAMQNDQDQISMVIVNNSDDDVTITLQADGIQAVQSLYQYNYWKLDRPADDNGFPVAKAVWENADLSAGLHVKMPANGIVYFTTIQPN